jgi:hypothetical protein
VLKWVKWWTFRVALLSSESPLFARRR